MRRLRSACVGVVVCLTVTLSAAVTSGATSERTGPTTAGGAVPVATVKLPAAIDSPSFYEAQAACDPVARPGTVALANLLQATYGPSTVYITRACSASTSEHFDGRALDWMHSVREPTQRAQAESFLEWLLAPGLDGTPQEMARRLGVMYVIWNNRMIRMYDPGRGWTNYRGCQDPSRSAPSLDTACHRNHVHLSLSWDGAAGLTSWWTGRTVSQPYCRAATSKGRAGPGSPQMVSGPSGLRVSAIPPAVVLDTPAGKGAGLSKSCRVLAGRTLYPQVRVSGFVPKTAKAVAVRVSASSNAPAVLNVRSSRTARAAQLAIGPGVTSALVLVPVASNGTIAISTTRGAANVGVSVVGYLGSALPKRATTPVAVKPTTPTTGTSPAPGVTRPSQARSITATAGGTTVTTAWKEPTSAGGDEGLTYRVEALASSLKGAKVLGTCMAGTAESSCAITGLATGRTYWMSVSVGNSAGRTWSPRKAVRLP